MTKLKLNKQRGAVLKAVLKSFEIADKVQRKNFKKVVEEYSKSFLRNNVRQKDKLPKRNTEIIFYQECDFIRLTQYGKKELSKINNFKSIKLKESNQYVHNDLIWDFIVNYLMYTTDEIELMREGATMKGTISDAVIETNEYKLYLEAETGTQAAHIVADKIRRYELELQPHEFMVVYSSKANKLKDLNWSNQIILLDSTIDYDKHISTLNNVFDNINLLSNTITSTQILDSFDVESEKGKKLDWSRINTQEMVNYWREI